MSDSSTEATVRTWLVEPLASDVSASLARLARAEDVKHIAVMPDVHLARDVCVGAVVATRELLYPAAVGGDIGCGMAAQRFHAPADVLTGETSAARLLAGLYQYVPSNRHSAATMPHSLPAELADCPLSAPSLERLKLRDGRVQLGTLGRGNHFLEFQEDEEGYLWVMVHSGSRAMGQAITVLHTSAATAGSGSLRSLCSATAAGEAYLADMQWARTYAASNRLAMLKAVEDLLDRLFGIHADADSLLHADHNHVCRESHSGQTYFVHRKGAQSAAAGEPGIIPGSMGTASFHTVGRGCAEALHSSSHGAGRKLSRTDARRQISRRTLSREMQAVWFDERRANLLREEAPSAYKDIHQVMRAQQDLTKIVRKLRPILCYKGI